MKQSTHLKKQLAKNAVSALVLATLTLGAQAETSETVHLGKADVSKDQVINLLAPKPTPKLLTRGIRVHGAEADPSEAPAQSSARALSLEVYFEFNSAQLSPEAMAQLSPVGEALQSNELSGLDFTLEGHTDAIGDANYNLSLSERRANSVKRFFIERYALSPERLRAEGKGESELIEGTPPNSGIHRRVTIIAH